MIEIEFDPIHLWSILNHTPAWEYDVQSSFFVLVIHVDSGYINKPIYKKNADAVNSIVVQILGTPTTL